MLKLLHRELRAKEGSKEEEHELAKRPKMRVTVGNWIVAFLICASIYCKKYLVCSVALFKYIDVIRKAYISYGGYARMQYDDEFWACLAADLNAQWGKIDLDLWQYTLGPAKALHVTGVENDIADALTHSQQRRINGLASGAYPTGTQMPQELWTVGDSGCFSWF
ncbi:hypothetical protein NDU88_001112 [Pleurodeles waltl]|uniref:Uncharacterized protein n=1 Tax=Pleurodeles waltl TaxID=8319 RepID=A0AAV7VAE7_PLEWA|nr:hypothetical protein NDU88_001112 [Pleurodeles waltl]